MIMKVTKNYDYESATNQINYNGYKKPISWKPYTHLCSITLVLGTSFQNWASSGTPDPEDWSISAAIIRKRSCREAEKPALKEKK